MQERTASITVPPLQGHSMPSVEDPNAELARLYPKYHKPLPAHWQTVDVYRVHSLFPVVDPSGRLVHSSKKLLLSGVRTGGKSQYDDVREARDTLNGWLADNAPATTTKEPV